MWTVNLLLQPKGPVAFGHVPWKDLRKLHRPKGPDPWAFAVESRPRLSRRRPPLPIALPRLRVSKDFWRFVPGFGSLQMAQWRARKIDMLNRSPLGIQAMHNEPPAPCAWNVPGLVARRHGNLVHLASGRLPYMTSASSKTIFVYCVHWYMFPVWMTCKAPLDFGPFGAKNWHGVIGTPKPPDYLPNLNHKINWWKPRPAGVLLVLQCFLVCSLFWFLGYTSTELKDQKDFISITTTFQFPELPGRLLAILGGNWAQTSLDWMAMRDISKNI